MSRRNVIALILAAASLAAPAQAQFQPVVMKLSAWNQAELATGSWSGASGDDLLVILAGGTPSGKLLHYRDLLTEYASPYAAPTSVRAGAIGPFDGSSAGGVPDVAWGVAAGISVSWGESPDAYDSFPALFTSFVKGMAAVRLLPSPRTEPVLVVSAGTGSGFAGRLYAVDLSESRGPPAASPATRFWSVPGFWGSDDGDTIDRIYPIRLSPAAIASGVDDAIVPLAQGFFLLWHGSAPTGTALADLNGMTAAVFGASGPLALTNGGFLPDGAQPEASCLGAAAMDVDGDGLRDLVFSYGAELYPSIPGWLLWIRNTGTGNVSEMTSQKPWNASLMGRADLPIIDAGALRQLDLGTTDPAFAVFDRTLGQILVVRGTGAAGFRVTTLPAPGVLVREMIAADVVGSSAKDLVVLVDLAPDYTTSEVWVYPDEGDMATVLSWSPAPPLVALAGFDLPLGVSALDPDQPATLFEIKWYLSDPAASVETGSSWTAPAAELCGPETSLEVTVRALDSLGLYTEVAASIPIEWRPSLSLLGASPPGRLLVAPGGASGRAEGSAWPACGGSPVFTWGESGLAGIVQTGAGSTGSTAWREFTIPESAYADLLDGTAAITLRAVDAGRDGTTPLPLVVDARGLVEATVAFDRAALAQGDLGAAQIRLESRIGLPLPRVRVLVRLAGLSFAGSMRVTGTPATLGPGLGELIIDPLPAHGTAVEIVVPVRALGTPGAVSVELFSEGGDRVSPEASPDAGDGSLPGCGCGDGGAGPLGLLLVILGYMKPMRRVLASTRSTSSSTRITRQA